VPQQHESKKTHDEIVQIGQDDEASSKRAGAMADADAGRIAALVTKESDPNKVNSVLEALEQMVFDCETFPKASAHLDSHDTVLEELSEVHGLWRHALSLAQVGDKATLLNPNMLPHLVGMLHRLCDNKAAAGYTVQRAFKFAQRALELARK
jgi:hypothetical protein